MITKKLTTVLFPCMHFPCIQSSRTTLVHNCVSHYLSSNSLLSTLQFGFRRGSSTQDVLLLTPSWHQLLSSNQQVSTVFFDISKALDSVPHDKILDSLARVGIGGSLFKWFTDYLHGRQQCVVIDGASSSASPATSVVPQGSILAWTSLVFHLHGLNYPTSSFTKLQDYSLCGRHPLV